MCGEVVGEDEKESELGTLLNPFSTVTIVSRFLPVSCVSSIVRFALQQSGV